MNACLAVIASVAVAFVAASATAQPDTARTDCNSYSKIPDRVTYGMDDGGCYLCSKASSAANAWPLTGTALSDHCQRLCESDERCVAYTVSRPGSLPAQVHQYGRTANCCLELRSYPPGAFVEIARGGDPRTDCERESMCWTRYERNGDEYTRRRCAARRKRIVPEERPCEAVWTETSYDDDEVSAKIEFISGGCERGDPVLRSLLTKAHEECRADAYAESTSMTIVRHPSAVYVHATIGGIGEL